MLHVQRTFRDNSQKGLSTIVMGISTALLYLVTSCETPKDVWDTLRSHFERDTPVILEEKVLPERNESKYIDGSTFEGDERNNR